MSDNTNNEYKVRLERLKYFQENGVDPYPAKSNKSHSIGQALEEKHGTEVTIAGRIMTKRDMGKLGFANIQDESGTMQVVYRKDVMDEAKFKMLEKKFDSGDIVEFTGERFATDKGQESILIKDYKLLSKSLRPLPEKWHGLQDEDTRYRKRYLEMATNPEVREMFVRKSKFWNSVRTFLMERGFLEVETPVLETTTGGADANPFVTHHDALDIDVFLRISNGELWQKRLMVGGFEKTFELGRQFRNEGMSREHLQDYTQMEFYYGYADYEMGMELVEEMYKYVIKNTWGKSKFDIFEFKDIDIDQKWERLDYRQAIIDKLDIDILEASEDDMRAKLTELGVKMDKSAKKGRLMDYLWKQVRKNVKGPVFLVNHPVEVSPLAKRKVDNPELTQRFQPIIAGSELGQGYSELNDPIDQRERFEEQQRMRDEGDDEAQMNDEEFVEALEQGMPPTCGYGMSERVFAFFESKPVRECVMFPLMRPEK